jgi:predicted Zn-ribbon and HTH transcriptional regulator
MQKVYELDGDRFIKCTCGAEVFLDDPMTNECESCGTLWNSAGQELRPQNEWEEDDGYLDESKKNIKGSKCKDCGYLFYKDLLNKNGLCSQCVIDRKKEYESEIRMSKAVGEISESSETKKCLDCGRPLIIVDKKSGLCRQCEIDRKEEAEMSKTVGEIPESIDPDTEPYIKPKSWTIQYRIPGKAPKEKSFKSEAARNKFIEAHADDAIEVPAYLDEATLPDMFDTFTIKFSDRVEFNNATEEIAKLQDDDVLDKSSVDVGYSDMIISFTNTKTLTQYTELLNSLGFKFKVESGSGEILRETPITDMGHSYTYSDKISDPYVDALANDGNPFGEENPYCPRCGSWKVDHLEVSEMVPDYPEKDQYKCLDCGYYNITDDFYEEDSGEVIPVNEKKEFTDWSGSYTPQCPQCGSTAPHKHVPYKSSRDEKHERLDAEIKREKEEVCTDCDGEGIVEYPNRSGDYTTKTCEGCDGTGKMKSVKKEAIEKVHYWDNYEEDSISEPPQYEQEWDYCESCERPLPTGEHGLCADCVRDESEDATLRSIEAEEDGINMNESIYYDLELVPKKAVDSKEIMYLVKKNGTDEPIGFITKFKDTRTDTNPWKAYVDIGVNSKFIDSYYSEEGGKEAAIKAIFDAHKTSIPKITEALSWEEVGMSPEDLDDESGYDSELMCPDCKGWGVLKDPKGSNKALGCKVCKGTGDKNFHGEITGAEAEMHHQKLMDLEEINQIQEALVAKEVPAGPECARCGSHRLVYDSETRLPVKCDKCGAPYEVPDVESMELSDKDREEQDELEYKKSMKLESVGVTTSDAGVYQKLQGQVFPDWDFPTTARSFQDTSPEGATNVGKKKSTHSSRMYPRMSTVKELAEKLKDHDTLKKELFARSILQKEDV